MRLSDAMPLARDIQSCIFDESLSWSKRLRFFIRDRTHLLSDGRGAASFGALKQRNGGVFQKADKDSRVNMAAITSVGDPKRMRRSEL